MDAEARHYRKMKNAIWLYLYLLLNANRKTGVLMRNIETVSRDMGVPRDTPHQANCSSSTVQRRIFIREDSPGSVGFSHKLPPRAPNSSSRLTAIMCLTEFASRSATVLYPRKMWRSTFSTRRLAMTRTHHG